MKEIAKSHENRLSGSYRAMTYLPSAMPADCISSRPTLIRRTISGRRFRRCMALLGALSIAVFDLPMASALEPSVAARADKVDRVPSPPTRHSSYSVNPYANLQGFFVDGFYAPPVFKKNTITLKVIDVDENPLAGVVARLYRQETLFSDPELLAQASTNDRGATEFSDLVSPDRVAKCEQEAAKSKSPDYPSDEDSFYVVLQRAGMGTIILREPVFSVATSGVERKVCMRPKAELQGRVTDQSGKPVAGAVVAVGGRGGTFAVDGVNSVKTDSDGRYRFADLVVFQRKRLISRKPGKSMWLTESNDPALATYDAADDLSVSNLCVTHPAYAVTSVRGGSVPGTADVVMVPATELMGRVVDYATKEPKPDVLVRATRHPVLTAALVEDLALSEYATDPYDFHHFASTRTDATGHYEFNNLPAGVYDVWAEPPANDWNKVAWICRGIADVKVDSVNRAAVAPDLIVGPGATVHGQLVDAASGQPLELESESPTVKVLSIFVSGPNFQPFVEVAAPVSSDGKFQARVFPGDMRLSVTVDLDLFKDFHQTYYQSDQDSLKSAPVLKLRQGESVDATIAVRAVE